MTKLRVPINLSQFKTDASVSRNDNQSSLSYQNSLIGKLKKTKIEMMQRQAGDPLRFEFELPSF